MSFIWTEKSVSSPRIVINASVTLQIVNDRGTYKNEKHITLVNPSWWRQKLGVERISVFILLNKFILEVTISNMWLI